MVGVSDKGEAVKRKNEAGSIAELLEHRSIDIFTHCVVVMFCCCFVC